MKNIAKIISRSRFGNSFEVEGNHWKWNGSMSGSFEQGISEKGKVWCYRAECDLIFKIADKTNVRKFVFSKFAKDFDEYIDKKSEFLAVIVCGLSKTLSTDDILKSLEKEAYIKEIPLEEEPFNPNFCGYSWKRICQNDDLNFSLYDETWQTVEDKNRPTLKVRLFEKSEGEFYEILSNENGEIERKVDEQIDNRYDAFNRLKHTMHEVTLYNKIDS